MLQEGNNRDIGNFSAIFDMILIIHKRVWKDKKAKISFGALPFVINAVFLQKISLFLCFSQNNSGSPIVYEIYSPQFQDYPFLVAARGGHSSCNGTEERQEALHCCH